MPIEIEGDSEQEIFEQTGGKILESYPDGRPKKWLCGVGENGEIIDPRGKEKEAIRYLNKENQWEAGNPDEDLIKEIKRWRSDWHDIKS